MKSILRDATRNLVQRLALLGGLMMFVIPSPAHALEALYVGGQVGHVALLGTPGGTFNNALGFGADIGFRTNSYVDIMISLLTSSHASAAGDLGLLAPTLSADFHIGRAYDFDFTLGVGPGFYSYKHLGVSDTKFGLNFGGAVDVIIDEHFRVGLGTKYHLAFGGDVISGNFWTATMRVGYLFTFDDN